MIKTADPRIQALQRKIYQDLKIDDTRLSNELKDQASKFAYWAAAHSIKLNEYQVKKQEVEEREAALSRIIEYNLKESKEQDPKIRITDSVIKSEVKTNDEYSGLKRELLELALEEGLLASAKEAFRQRGQALLEMCRNERNELTQPEAVYQRKLMKEYEVNGGKV
jgi:DNA-directed RNA polymerase subunit H (RpoH/RPB5)